MIDAGFCGLLAIAAENTDHLWIILADEASDPLAVLVMLTDARNIENPDLILEAGKRLTPQFRLSKPSTIDLARAVKVDWSRLRLIVGGTNFYDKGFVGEADLRAIRLALLRSANTPVDVLEYCRGRGWG